MGQFMKSKVKNFFLCNVFRMFLLAGFLLVYIFHAILGIYIIYTSWYDSWAIGYMTIEIFIFLIMLLPIAFVIYKIIKSRNETYEPYSISMYLGSKIFTTLFLIVIYFLSYLLLRWVFLIIIYWIAYSLNPCIIIV